jgi:hypothetical protein
MALYLLAYLQYLHILGYGVLQHLEHTSYHKTYITRNDHNYLLVVVADWQDSLLLLG